jgi:hypothetical protein
LVAVRRLPGVHHDNREPMKEGKKINKTENGTAKGSPGNEKRLISLEGVRIAVSTKVIW